MKKIFLTGGEGLIGSYLINKLQTLGYETASFDPLLNFIENPLYYEKCLKIRKKIFKKPSKIYRADIRDKDKLKKSVNDFKPDILIHLGAISMARIAKKFESDMLSINLTGTTNVLDVFEQSTAKKIIYTSSSMAYGHFKQYPQTEESILDPVNQYGACKAAGEYFVKLSKKDWVIIRPTSVYGFTDCANRVSQLLIDAAFMKKPAWIIKGETLDFSYIDDVVDGFIRSIKSPQAVFQTFNISRGESRSVEEFAEIIKQYFPDFQYEVRNPEGRQVWRGPLSITKAQKFLKFNPKYNLEKGIKTTLTLIKEYEFYKNLNPQNSPR